MAGIGSSPVIDDSKTSQASSSKEKNKIIFHI